MYGLSTLKPRLDSPERRIACPVRGCRVEVPLQGSVGRRTEEHQCPVHRIFLSGSSMRYERETDNLLWTDRESLSRLNACRLVPGRSFAGELSPDAVLWNVFGWLDRAGLLAEALERWVDRPVLRTEAWFWGRGRDDEDMPFALRKSTSAFREEEIQGVVTRPPLMVESDDVVFVVDPRMVGIRPVTSGAGASEGYVTGGDRWSEKVLAEGWRDAFLDRVLGELLRFWLVGTYAAHLLEKEFVLLHVVPGWAGRGAADRLAPHLRQEGGRSLAVGQWEDVYRLALERPGAPDVDAFLTYIEEKSAGYDSSGRLLRAFSVQAPVAVGSRETRVS